MNINRNNYQEYLLLYIDGELSAEVEQEVDTFLELNTDIKQEFDDLLNTKLQPEDIAFGDISYLLKSEEKSIVLNNYEEKFLLYVDKEMTATEEQSVETFVLQHPELQSTFTALKNTVLPLEIIQHPNKEELYKKERKPIVFYLQKVAVAAVFIGFVAFMWNSNSNITNTEIATIQANKIVSYSNNIAKKNNAENITLKENNLAVNNPKEEKNINSTTVKNIELEKQKVKNNLAPTVTKNTLQPLTNQSIISQNNQAQVNNTQSLLTTNTITKNSNISNNTPVAFVANKITEVNNSTAKQIVYKSLDDDDNNASIIDDKEVKTSKLKGFFKKAIQAITPKESDNNESKKLFAVTL
jgi:hypothetical protein